MAEVAVVEVQGEKRCVELGGEFFGQGGFAGAGAAGDAEDEGPTGQGELFGDGRWNSFCHGYDLILVATSCSIAICGIRAVRRQVNCFSAWRPVSMTSSWLIA